MSKMRQWFKRLRSQGGQSATEYMLVISVLSIAALAATSAFSSAYSCMFTGDCSDIGTGGVPAALAESLTKDGIQTVN